MDPRFSRAYGALAGLALGDALGMPTQGMSPRQIVAVYGSITGLVDGDACQPYAPGMAAGSVTDDTEQALLVASLLVRGRGSFPGRTLLDASDFAHALLGWEDSMIARGSLDLLGPSTKAALERVRAGEDPETVGGEGTTNGAAMRVTPIGVSVSTADPGLFADAVWSSCQVTHATRQGFQSAALVAALVSLGIDSPDSSAQSVRRLAWEAVSFVESLPMRGAWSPEPDVVAQTRRALQLVAGCGHEGVRRLPELIGTSVACAQAIPSAFALAAHYADYRALVEAANMGGDTDTIGAIAGALIGACRGVDVFTDHGLSQVEEVSDLDLATIAAELLALRSPAPSIPGSRTRDAVASATVSSPPSACARGGHVVLLGQVLVDLAMRGERLPAPGGDVWATHEGAHVGGGFNALLAARRMGAEAVSLSPIGEGPNASLIRVALEREGIVDAGPRVAGVDNGYCVAFTDRTGERSFISTRGAETMTPANAWADFVQDMSPLDVLYIDGYLMDHPANREAAEAALRVLPEGVRVILDVSPVIGVPSGLPVDATIVSMNHREARALRDTFAPERTRADDCRDPRDAARALFQLFGCVTLVRAGAEGAYVARRSQDANSTCDSTLIHIPSPRVEAIDTNGAGDAHSGVLAACLALGIPLDRGLLLANCAGALSTTRVGPSSCPAREEIEAAANASDTGTTLER